MNILLYYEGPLVNYSYMCACMDTVDDCMDTLSDWTDNNGLYAGSVDL